MLAIVFAGVLASAAAHEAQPQLWVGNVASLDDVAMFGPAGLRNALQRAEAAAEHEVHAVKDSVEHALDFVGRFLKRLAKAAEAVVAFVAVLGELGYVLSDANVELLLQCMNTTITTYPQTHSDDPFFKVCPPKCFKDEACRDRNSPAYDAKKCDVCYESCHCVDYMATAILEIARPCCAACESGKLPKEQAKLKAHESCEKFEDGCKKATDKFAELQAEQLKKKGCAATPAASLLAATPQSAPATAVVVAFAAGAAVVMVLGVAWRAVRSPTLRAPLLE